VALQVERAVGSAQHDPLRRRRVLAHAADVAQPAIQADARKPDGLDRQADRHGPAGFLEEAEGGVAASPVDQVAEYRGQNAPHRKRQAAVGLDADQQQDHGHRDPEAAQHAEALHQAQAGTADDTGAMAAASRRRRISRINSRMPKVASPMPRRMKPSGMKPSQTPMKKVLAGTSRPTISSQALAS